MTGLVGSYKHYLSRRSLCQTEKVCESIHFLNVILIFFPMVLDRFNFMTPPLSLFYVFILLFCHFISLAVKGLCSREESFVTFCLLSYFGICYDQHYSL